MRGAQTLSLAGHRAMLLGPLKAAAAPRPPLVLIGGTAQWLDSWSGHLTPLARERQVLLYELRGQAGATSTLGVDNCGLAKQAEDMAAVLDEAGLANDPVDVCAFSFGGRVALAAAAAERPPRIRRLCLTGVSADRGHLGRLALRSWRASLAAGDLEGFVWRLILDTHSRNYLETHERQVEAWVRNVVAANSIAGMRAVVEQTHTDDPADPHHPLAMVSRVRAAGGVAAGLVICGAEDTMSLPEAGRALAEEAGWRFVELADAAHAAPIEQAVAWRRAVMGFLEE